MKHLILRILLIIFLIPTLSSCGGGSGNANAAETDTSDPSGSITLSRLVSCELNKREIDGKLSGLNEECIEIELPCFDKDKRYNNNVRVLYDNDWYNEAVCQPETIQIPNGRPVYAFLVNGFHQNRNLDMFHFYNFSKCLHAKGAYVHFAWWNNLLAPYMQKPLHNNDSQPSHTANPWWLEDYTGDKPFSENIYQPRKATPRDDYQFQQDAERVLVAIREYNPDAKIILVGHSMGGDAVARLATANTDIRNIDIALVAPIDPVGNRSCLPPWSLNTADSPCKSKNNFTRDQTTSDDYLFLTIPPRRNFETNIEYLYYRFQREFKPPFDYQKFGLFFSYHGAEGTHTDDRDIDTAIIGGTTNIQSQSPTSSGSWEEVPHGRRGYGGGDGHGEMVGFRGAFLPFGPNIAHIFYPESWPLALYAGSDWATTDPLNFWGRLVPGWPVLDWPSRDTHPCPGGPEGAVGCNRVEHLKSWETDPNHLYKKGFEPYNPNLCAVSPDLCNILDKILPDTKVNKPPVANAGSDQILECTDPNETKVFLDGSGSTDPDGTIERFDWNWSGNNSATGEEIVAYLPLGTHKFTLTVRDNGGLTDTDTVDVTVQDTTAPTLSITLLPNLLSPSNHKMVTITANIQNNDSCDDSPTIKLVSITSNEADNGLGDGDTSNDIQGAEFGTDDREFLLRAERSGKGLGRIYTVTYSATDSSGNVTYATAEVTVPHDHGKSK